MAHESIGTMLSGPLRYYRHPSSVRVIARSVTIVAIIGVRGVESMVRGSFLFLRGRREPRGNLVGCFLRRVFEDLGPTFIKIGQILSNRPDLLSPLVINELTQLQQNVRPISFETVRRTIEHQLSKPIGAVFSAFDETPISSASVSQVHRAVLRDGSLVAVKVRRPELADTVAADIAVFKVCGRLLKRLPGMGALPIIEAIDAVGEALFAQLNFLSEVANSRRFRDNFQDADHIRFPDPIESDCQEGVLVMELITDLVAVSDLPKPEINTELAATRALQALFKMIFVDGFVHADLHPGNLFFRSGNEIVILDLGFVVELDFEDRMDFAKFFSGMVTNNGDLCAYVVLKTAVLPPEGFDREAFRAEINGLVAAYVGKTANDFELIGFISKLFELQRKMRLTGTTKFMMTIVALLVFEGIAKRLVPDLDFQKEAKEALIQAIVR